MNCTNCGSPLMGNERNCGNCGAPVVQNAVPQQQVPMNNQPMQNAPVAQQKKSKGGVIFLIVGIIVVVLAFAIMVGGTLVLRGSKANPEDTKVQQANPVSTSTKFYKVLYKGYSLKIPDNYIYQITDGGLYVGDEAQTWAAQMDIVEVNYDNFVSSKTNVVQVLQSAGYTASNIQEKTAGGIKYLTVEIGVPGASGIYYFSKLNSMNTMVGIVTTVDGVVDYQLLEELAPIIESAEQSMETVNMSTDIPFDSSLFANMATPEN